MKQSWKHSQYYTFTQSFPTTGLICMASISDPSESLDGFFHCSSTHRIEEQMKSKEVSGLPKSLSLGSCPKSVSAGEPAHVSACAGTQTFCKASSSISTLWRGNRGAWITLMKQLLWEKGTEEGNFPFVWSYLTLRRNWAFFLYWALIVNVRWKLYISSAFIGWCQQQGTFRGPQIPAKLMSPILLLAASAWALVPCELHTLRSV